MLTIDKGIWRRPKLSTEEELKLRVPQGDYKVARPITIYTESLERKNH